jgi:hypothetical protein
MPRRKQIVPGARWWDEAIRDCTAASVAAVMRSAMIDGGEAEVLAAFAAALKKFPANYQEWWRGFVTRTIPALRRDAQEYIKQQEQFKTKHEPKAPKVVAPKRRKK